MAHRMRPLVAALAVAFSGVAASQTSTLDDVVVRAKREAGVPMVVTVGDSQLQASRSATSDAASLLRDVPGISLYTAGGTTSLPVIHGLADDRLRITVDGMDFIASCPNHMNPPLGYVDPGNVRKFTVYTGITPVSVGGDSIGGAIVAETVSPVFAVAGQGLVTQGEVGAFYRSNGNAVGGNASATIATENLSITYTGATVKADNYKAAKDFKTTLDTGRSGHTLAKDEVGSTAYETQTHTLNIAMRSANHLLEAKAGFQNMPEQLYPNQRMDMLDNQQKRLNLRYLGQFDWGNLEARAYQEEVHHFMDFGADKQYNYGTLSDLNNPAKKYQVDGMPMYTRSRTKGLALRSEINLSDRDLLRAGLLWQSYRLDDWWPPAPDCGVGNCIGGMAPLTFLNINNGQRDRKAAYGEWEAKWSSQWTSLIGLRIEDVTTDADPVNGYTSYGIAGATQKTMMGVEYGAMYAGASVAGGTSAFNAMNRKRSDTNWDFTALAAYQPGESFNGNFGYSRKTRSPNLYERYSWSTNTMAMVMNNFVGDGNGYVGNPDLKPEVAHTVSATLDWHSADRQYQFVATPYYSYVQDFIDAQRSYPGAATSNLAASNAFVRLQYVNQNARLFGLDLAGKMPLARNSLGQWGMRGQINYVNGRNLETHDALYNVMPLNGKLALTHQLGVWDSTLEVVGVKGKQDVSDVRNEIKTSGYALAHFRTSYTLQKNVRIDFGVENIFDRYYTLPLGGAYVGQGMTMSISGVPWGIGVPGMGRNLYAGLNVKF